MAGWLRREVEPELPEALKGKTPEQVATELAALQNKATELETLKASVVQKDQQLTTVNAELVRVTERIRTLEANPPKEPKPNSEAAPTQVTSVLEDEDKAFNERMRPLANAILSNSAQTAKMVAEARVRSDPVYNKLLTKYQKDVDTLFASVPPQYQQFPETYERVFRQVLGDHIQEISEDQVKSGTSLFVEGGGGPPPLNQEADKNTLNADEIEVARKMKIPQEAFLKSKGQMREAGGHISFER